MIQYLNILKKILKEGSTKSDRTEVGTKSIFGTQSRYDLSEGFPLLTTKKLFTRGIFEELLWMIKGDTNIEHLEKKKINIWTAWKDPSGKKYPPYGKMWRAWPGSNGEEIDQLGNVIHEIKTNPGSRRLIVSAWNPAEMDNFVLPPCHTFFQFNIRGEYLDLQLYQRSADIFLGVPFNIASYALLLMMVAQVTKYKPGIFIHTTGDTHLYLNHLEQAELQLTRKPKKLPTVILNPNVKNIEEFTIDDIMIFNYEPWPHIKAEVAV